MLRRAIRSLRIRISPPDPKPLILLYHRIADEPIDPWALAVSPAHFEEHLDVLRRTRHPLPLKDFFRGLQTKTLSAEAIAVTFDDGYMDNLFAAKPRLAAADVPATVFLATGYLGQAREFWWDELARLVLAGTGPRKLDVPVGGRTIRIELEDDASSGSVSWRAWLDAPRTQRQAAYLATWTALRALEVQERETGLAALRNALAGSVKPAASGRPMTSAEVQALVKDRLITIGAHTVTHPVLPEIDPLSRHREIVESKKACQALTDAEVSEFAYPFGSLDADVRSVVEDAGFCCACSTRHGPTTLDSDVFALPRIHVLDCGGDAFERSLHHASMAPPAA